MSSSASSEKKSSSTTSQVLTVVFYTALWYIGNILYIKYNKEASDAFAIQKMMCPKNKNCSGNNKHLMVADGKPDGTAWAMSVATGQLLVGVIYALYLWIAPDCRPMPKITIKDVQKMAPTGICSALAHASSVFALTVGGIAFGSIVKAAEPVFSAIISAVIYKHAPSTAKFLCFIPIVGGIAIASLKFQDNFTFLKPETMMPKIDNDFFSMPGLLFACAANVFAAFKGLEGKKIKDDKDLKEKLGNEANSFAVFGIISLLASIPLMIFKEGSNPGGLASLVNIVMTKENAMRSLLLSGATFYLYNECAFMTLKSDKNPAGMDAVTNSVANTAKRVVVIYYGSLISGHALSTAQIVGCSICIIGVFVYSVIDDIVKKFQKPKVA